MLDCLPPHRIVDIIRPDTVTHYRLAADALHIPIAAVAAD